MIRNIFKEIKERREHDEIVHSEKMKLGQRGRKILEDERLYDTTYVIYSSELPHLSPSIVEKYVEAVCNVTKLSYDIHYYPDGFVFYIYVKKREDPKYEVGDVYHQEENETDRPSDLLIIGRSYDGKGRYVYATARAYSPLLLENNKIHWGYLD